MPKTDRRNRGWFRKGDDPRRHVLTLAERTRGGYTWLHRYYLKSVSSPLYPCGGRGAAAELLEEARAAGHDDRPGQPRRGRGRC